ncbi:MAG: translational GTPase TypA [Caldisericia bacterium]
MHRNDLRNIGIIAHVDHGKTTLVDAMMRQCKLFRNIDQMGECILDTGDLERERGITIISKNMSLVWKGVKINIVDTPGHSDFGGEVERVLRMVDGVLLLVDASEGPMPQTRFVLKKALELNLRPIVVINKIDRQDARIQEVINETFDLFVELDASEEQLDFPVVYASGRDGKATMDLNDPPQDLTPLFQLMLKKTPAPEYDPASPLSVLVTNIAHDDYIGRIGIGRMFGGQLKTGDKVKVYSEGDTEYAGQILKLFIFEGLERKEVPSVQAGEIFAFAGIPTVTIGDSVTDPERPIKLNILRIEPPTVSMMFMVNDSPFGGTEGKFVTSNKLRERIEKELRTNVSIAVDWGNLPDRFTVAGRGELQLAILIEQMRREGYEFQVSMPQVITEKKGGKVLEPYETLVLDVPKEYQGTVINMLGERRGTMEKMLDLKGAYVRLSYTIPLRGLFGFRSEFLSSTKGNGVMTHTYLGYLEWAGKIGGRRNGVLVSDHTGAVSAYSIARIQDRGKLFVAPAEKVYAGQIVGETMRDHDLKVNPTKEKHLSNMRSSTSEISTKIDPPIQFALDQFLDYINEDELLEVTPKSLRIRKRLLDFKERKRSGREEDDYGD